MPNRTTLAVLSLIVMSVPLALFAGERVTQIQKLSYPLASGGNFQIDNPNGKIDIGSWDQSQVSITATKEGDTQADLDAIQVDVKQESNAVAVHTIYSSPGLHRGAVSYQVMLPKDTGKVTVKTANGAVSVENVGGDLAIKSENGAISATNLKGAFNLDTTNGSIDAACTDFTADSKLRTTNGAITLSLPRSADVLVDAATTVGRIESDLPTVTSNKGFVGQSLEAKLGAGSHHLEVTTTNGSITLKAQ